MDNDTVQMELNNRISYFINLLILLDNIKDKEHEQEIYEMKQDTELQLLHQLNNKHKKHTR